MTNQTITETGFCGTPEHQELLMKVMKSDLTGYFEKWNCYMTLFFTCGKYWENFSRIEDADLEIFTDKIRVASAKYLELAHMEEAK